MATITEYKNAGKKIKFCRDQKVQNLILFLSDKTGIYFDPFLSRKNAMVRVCPHGSNCSKAHHISELDIKDHILELEKKDMKDFNAIDGYLNMIKILKKNVKKVSPEDRSLIKKVLEKENFIEVLNLWIDLSTRYHKIKNDLKDNAKDNGVSLKNFKRNRWRGVKPPSNSSTYQFPEDVPKFNFQNEDIWWAIHRKFNICMKAEECRNKVSNIEKNKITRNYKKNKKKNKNTLAELFDFALMDIKKKYPLYVFNMCDLETNCKYGVHLKKDQICVKDFIEGNCNCKNKDLYLELNDLKNEARNLDKLTPEYKKISKKISKLTSEVNKVMIHYTERGMIPIMKQIHDYKEKKKEIEEKKKESLKKEMTKVDEDVEDLDWDF